jgi:putative transposase
MSSRYPSDLSDKEFSIINSFYDDQRGRQGRPPSRQLRELWNAMFYILRSGCSWRMLPKEFPPWRTVYKHFRLLRISGKLDTIMRALNEKVRESCEKQTTPSVIIVDSQSVKTRSSKKSGQGF